MKRICFLTDSIFSFGGVQRVTAVIAKELAKDCDVTIVTLDREEAKDTTFYDLSRSDIHYRFFAYPPTPAWKLWVCKAYSYLYRKVLPQIRLTSDWYAHSSFPSEKRRALANELADGHYDAIVGVHAPLAVRLATCRKALGGTRLIGWIHNSYEALFGKQSLYIGPELRKHYEWQLEKLDKTVVLCHDDARKYPFDNLQIIYNPLTLTPGQPSAGTSKKFLAVGRFSRLHKGFDLLIEAFRIFANEDKDWTLDLVGEGVEEPMYRRLIGRYGLEDRVTIHPFTTRIQDYYSQAQVYVLSSRWEGFGLVLVEAMAHGLPVVSSNLPTSEEIMGDFGLYYINGDVNGLARRMLEATRIDWPSKSKEAMAIARRFDLGSIIRQWRQLLDASVSSK
ncbi:MAG: glycosyltransferase [Prevotella sp.]|nr:glycosyltransferase [Prevotella sp.]